MKKFQTEYLNSSKDSQEFWHRFNEIQNKGKNIVEPLLTGQNKYTFSDPEISNILKETHMDRSKSNNNFDDNFKISLENNLKEIINSSDLITSNNNITIEEVRATINKLNNLSVPGPDRICTLLIKERGGGLLNLIRNILNQTYNLGYYPKDWKQENNLLEKKKKIIYLKKPGKDSYHDPVLGKILERIIFNQILPHLETTNFFEGKNLDAYRRFFNTTRALLPLIEDMRVSIGNGKIGESIMAGLEGAFDASWRKGLMYKIYDCGITGNLFIIINIYLENRKA